MRNNEQTPPANADRKRQLFLDQKATLLVFLERGAISKAQFDKSFGDLMKLMGFDEEGNRVGLMDRSNKDENDERSD